MVKLKEKLWTNDIKDKIAKFLVVATIVTPFILIIGVAGGLEMGTITFPWE